CHTAQGRGQLTRAHTAQRVGAVDDHTGTDLLRKGTVGLLFTVPCTIGAAGIRGATHPCPAVFSEEGAEPDRAASERAPISTASVAPQRQERTCATVSDSTELTSSWPRSDSSRWR